jgi:hypothetical protein
MFDVWMSVEELWKDTDGKFEVLGENIIEFVL